VLIAVFHSIGLDNFLAGKPVSHVFLFARGACPLLNLGLRTNSFILGAKTNACLCWTNMEQH